MARSQTNKMNVDTLRKFCTSLPGVTEDIKWGNDLCFSVGNKMFTVTGVDDATTGISMKTTPDKFSDLIERPGIRPAHYVARYHWITIEDQTAVTDEEIRQLIKGSYQLVFDKLPAKIKRTIS